ncbi:MAG: hypothetical protein A3F90_05885 [Deltaproteobacteria bacterium RIFCSPLOWO2_12_FULL_60_19]|nr:MAG: hypothetical protein A3F90_05885 [Deltaproteobacteria bacterium RIFCSPLOWO2_12_FULL_60_19]
MKVVTIQQAVKRLKKLNEEIRYTSLVDGPRLSAGLISFSPRKQGDAKQIKHRDKDVLCQVLKGRGRLRIDGRRISLSRGTICHIPRGAPHDFAAGKNSDLVLFYSLIKTG